MYTAFVAIILNSCRTVNTRNYINSVSNKQELVSVFGYPQNYKDLGRYGKVWEYFDSKGRMYARFWVDNEGKIYKRGSY